MRSLPVAQVVCWVCKRGDKTLYRLRDKYGFKTPDYACALDRLVGLPKEPNQSLIPFPTREELEALKSVLAGREHNDQGGVAIQPTPSAEGIPSPGAAILSVAS